MAEFLNTLLDAWEDFVDFTMMAVYARSVPDWRFVLRVFLLAALLFGSAFLSATIAETRRHKMKFHFLLGLVLPYIYPVFIALRMKTVQEVLDIEEEHDPLEDLSSDMSARLKEIQQGQKVENSQRIKSRAPKEEVIVEEAVETEEAVEAVEAVEAEEVLEVEEASVYNQRYFQSLAVDSTGAKVGPFNLAIQNGTVFKVCQIKNIQVDMASFEVDVNGKIKNIRIKYENIVSFEKI